MQIAAGRVTVAHRPGTTQQTLGFGKPVLASHRQLGGSLLLPPISRFLKRRALSEREDPTVLKAVQPGNLLGVQSDIVGKLP